MSNDNEDDPLSGILGDELGEWDKMFDSLHETAEESSVSDVLAVAAKVDPPTPVVAIDDGNRTFEVGPRRGGANTAPSFAV